MPSATSIHAVTVAKAFTVDPGSVTNAQGLDVTVTIKGLRKGRPVILAAPSLEAHLTIGNAHCSALDTLKFRLGNPTAAPIDPASQTMFVWQY